MEKVFEGIRGRDRVPQMYLGIYLPHSFYNMHYRKKEELIRKIGIFGLRDVSKLAPIGDLGYANGWDPCSLFPTHGTFMDGGMERCIYNAACQQGYKFTCIGYNNRGTDTHYYCEELGMHYHVDSSD